MKLPAIIYEGADWRIVRVEIPPGRREPAKPGEPLDDGIRDLIEVTDGKDLLGTPRWRQLDGRTDSVSRLTQICHGMKREVLELMGLQRVGPGATSEE